jgi:nucleotide-binding universal stress UspA family protein
VQSGTIQVLQGSLHLILPLLQAKPYKEDSTIFFYSNQRKTVMHILKNILVPTDFSDFAHKALRYAEEVAQRVGGTIHLLHVIEPIGDWSFASDVQEQAFVEAEEKLEHLAKQLKAKGIAGRTAIERGHPEQQIVKFAREHRIDTIVMGTQGRRTEEDFLVGSTTERVLRVAPCPVLFVRFTEELSNGKDNAKHFSKAEYA